MDLRNKIQNRRAAEQVVQVEPSRSDVEDDVSVPEPIVVQEESRSNEAVGDSDSQDPARSDGGQPEAVQGGGSTYQTSPELTFDGFSYPGQAGFDAALIDIEPTFPTTAATPPGEFPSSVETPTISGFTPRHPRPESIRRSSPASATLPADHWFTNAHAELDVLGKLVQP